MGKVFDKRYFFAGENTSCGSMQCTDCGEEIDNMIHDWMSSKKTKKDGDWYYITRHRKCAASQSGWNKIESEQALRKERICEIEEYLSQRCSDNDFREALYNVVIKLWPDLF